MGRGGESFERRQRERAKKAKASAKREQRLQKSTEETEEPGVVSSVDEAAVLDQLGKLHQAFEDKAISLDDFEDARGELLAKLQVE
jgi:hypothetical protein